MQPQPPGRPSLRVGPTFVPPPPRRRRRVPWRILIVAALLGTAIAVGAVWTNAFGAGDRFAGLLTRIDLFLDPPPNRPIRPAVTVTPKPVVTPSPTPRRSIPPDATPEPTPTPTPEPVRTPIDVRLNIDPDSVFASEITKEWCAPAGIQMVLAMHGLADTSERFQRELVGRVKEWESWQDSHNGDWGPNAMVLALEAYGAHGYQLEAYDTRQAALRRAAVALSDTSAPVILIAWRGAHTWVMNGYRADADPRLFPDATVTGTYILDPWYPRVSTIWGPSDGPGVFQDTSEMIRNYLPWARPEGKYPDRDGKFLLLAPTLPRT